MFIDSFWYCRMCFSFFYSLLQLTSRNFRCHALIYPKRFYMSDLSVCLLVHLSIYLCFSACLPVCLPICQSTSLVVFLAVSLFEISYHIPPHLSNHSVFLSRINSSNSFFLASNLPSFSGTM